MTVLVCLVSPSPLIPLPSRERGFCRLCCLVHPCYPAALWFPAYAGMTVWWLFCLVSPSPLIPLPSRERGIMVGVLLYARHRPCGLRIKSSMTVRPRRIHPVVSRLRGNDGVVELSCCHPHLSPLPSRERGTEVVLSLCLVMAKSWFCSPFR